MKKYHNIMHGHLSVIILVITALLFFGCPAPVKTYYTVERQKPTEIQKGDKLVVDVYPHFEKEQMISRCISKAFKKLNKDVEVIPSDEFRRIAFSDSKSSNLLFYDGPIYQMIENPFNLMNLQMETSKDPLLLSQIESLNVHYVILADIIKYTGRPQNWGHPTHPPYGGHTWHRIYSIGGTVIDLKLKCKSGYISAIAEGDHLFGVMLIFPIGVIAYTEASACAEFGERVAKFLIGEKIEE